jgi:hypothetical protein
VTNETGEQAGDDESVGDSDRLLRRIHPDHLVIDHNRGGKYRPSSAAFMDGFDGISVFLGSALQAIPRAEEEVLKDHGRHSLVAFPARVARTLPAPLGVLRDPDPPDTPPHCCSPAHALLVGLLSDRQKRLKRQQKPLAKAAQEFVVLRPPPDETSG